MEGVAQSANAVYRRQIASALVQAVATDWVAFARSADLNTRKEAEKRVGLFWLAGSARSWLVVLRLFGPVCRVSGGLEAGFAVGL